MATSRRVGNYATSANAVARASDQIFDAAMSGKPDFTKISKEAIKGRSLERRAVTKAEADVASAGLKAFTDTNLTRMREDTKKEIADIKRPAKRMAGAVAGLGSKFAVDQAGRDDIAIITTDIDEQVAEFIKDGELAFSIGGHWMVGGFGLIQLYDYIHGFRVMDTQPLFSLIPVTATNVDKYANILSGCILSKEDIRNLSRVHNPDADLPGFIDSFSKNWESFM